MKHVVRKAARALALSSFLFILTNCGDREYSGTEGGSAGGTFTSTTNAVGIHKSSSSQYRIDCLTCHSDVLTKTTLNSSIPDAHSAMLSHTPGASNEDKCVYCHADTDLEQHSAGDLRRNVAVKTCDVCHGPNGPSTKQFYQK